MDSLRALLLKFQSHRTVPLVLIMFPPLRACPSLPKAFKALPSKLSPVLQASRRPLSGTIALSDHQLHTLTVSRMGELEPWIDENFVRNLWFQIGEQVSVKMIRDKFSGFVDPSNRT
jgi:hypothetical protein